MLIANTLTGQAPRRPARFAGFEGPGRYSIANFATRKALELDRVDHRSVLLAGARYIDTQAWNIQPSGEGWFYIRSAANGDALEASGSSGDRPAICAHFDGGSRQQWRIEEAGEAAAIVARDGRALEFPAGRGAFVARMADRNENGGQLFRFRRILAARPDP